MNPKARALKNKLEGQGFKDKLKGAHKDVRSFALTKAMAHDYFKAKRDHKKLPPLKRHITHKKPEFARMSMDEFEKKYGTV